MKKLFFSMLALPLLFVSCKKQDHEPKEKNKFTVTIENVSEAKMYLGSGIINTPVGQEKPGALKPGNKYEFKIKAGKGQKMSFAVMLAATNDVFFAPDEMGIALYDNSGAPIASQDVTNQVYLWDAGTEINEEPAVGPNTVTNQSGPNTGPAENGVVQKLSMVATDNFAYPSVSEVIHVMVKHISDYYFMVTIENVSKNNALKTSNGNFPAPVSPGVWVVHMGDSPLFTPGEADRGQGIEAIAEDGSAMMLGEYVAANTGITHLLSPGAWAVHKKGVMPIFTKGAFDYGEGLEGVAEDGDPAKLGMSLKGKQGVKHSEIFNKPDGAAQPGPLHPGMQYKFSFTASNDDYLSLATMFVQSNDLFYAPGDDGIKLYNSHSQKNGDVTSEIYLWDAGTEKNEEPGYGPNQIIRQSAPNTGVDEKMKVNKVDDEFDYPADKHVIRVTISPY